MKSFLKKLIERKKAEMESLKERSKKSEDINEVRAIGETLATLRSEIDEAEKQLAQIEADEQNGGTDEDAGTDERSATVGGMTTRSGQPVNFTQANGQPQQRSTDPADSVEYRTAFMNYVCRNVPIPTELRAEGVTTTADGSAVIPTTLMKEIIKELDTYGNVYAAVRKLNVQGGIAIPVLSLKPTATWIGETTPSADQKLAANETITFSYFGIECKIAQTLLASVVTLDAFQQLFVPLASEAIVKGVEVAIFHGNGTTQPLGILNDTRVKEDNVITMTAAEFASWAGWHTKVKAKMKKAYRNGTFFMNQATFDGQIDGMVDEQGQPVGRTNYGINGEETYRFMGKTVETVEDECLPAYEDAAEGDVVAVFMKPTDYAVNSNMELKVVKWIDHDTNEVKNKAIMICDGKLVDANGVLIIKKGAAVSA